MCGELAGLSTGGALCSAISKKKKKKKRDSPVLLKVSFASLNSLKYIFLDDEFRNGYLMRCEIS